jgi:RNA polymerase sigma-70 factor (ECF subfamily)
MADLGDRIARWQAGDKASVGGILPAVYDELRRLARIYLGRERLGHSLRRTELANEACVRMVGQRQVDWRRLAHFLIGARALRRVLAHHAGNRDEKKRAGYADSVSVDAALASVEQDTAGHIVALDRAMERLAQVIERQAGVVERRFFGGLTVVKTAEALGLSAATVKRGWTVARLCLRREPL